MSAVDHICCIFLREHDGQCRYSIPLDCMVCVYIVRGVLAVSYTHLDVYKRQPLKQCVFDDSHSPKYQKFKIDKLPKIIYYEKWDYKDYIPYLSLIHICQFIKTISPQKPYEEE